MMTREELETLLHIHGESLQSRPERIREVLVGAQYPESEITILLTYTQNHPDRAPKRVSGLHKIFRTDQCLAPEEINALLGIEVTIDTLRDYNKPKTRDFLQTLMIIVFTLLLAAFGLIFTMYFGEIGIFHEAAVFGSLTM
jgi:hypothetical protein